MGQPIFRVRDFRIVAPYTVAISFDDDTKQVIDFVDVLSGDLFGPLRDLQLFDPEVHTLVWPNGADFDPATLHDWPAHREAMAAWAEKLNGRLLEK